MHPEDLHRAYLDRGLSAHLAVGSRRLDSFMQGIPAERVNRTRIDTCEPDYQLMVAVIATKSPRARA